MKKQSFECFQQFGEHQKDWVLYAVLHLIRVDNRITGEEKDCLRDFLSGLSGNENFDVSSAEERLSELKFTPVPDFSPEEKFEILSLLVEFVISDGSVHPDERSLMAYIGKLFQMNRSDVNSLIHACVRQKKILQEIQSLQDRYINSFIE